MSTRETLLALVSDCGATDAKPIVQDGIVYDLSFAGACRVNTCGNYGRCHMCPPDVGEPEKLMERARTYPNGILYESVYPLEDAFDYEGMMDARKRHANLTRRIQERLSSAPGDFLHLGVGGCGICETCAKVEDAPCRFPEKALASLESYCVFVSETARNAGLPYRNGQNSITYFGLILYR